MERYFVCVEGGDTLGPWTMAEIRERLVNGELPPQTWVQPAVGAAPDANAWDYAFSRVELREAIPKPVVNARRKAPPSGPQMPLFDASAELSGLLAIVHDQVHVYEAKVAKADVGGFILKDMGSHRLREGAKVFVHLFDQQAQKSVNVWTELTKKSKDFVYLESRELPPQAKTKLQELLKRFSRLKTAA